MFSLHDDVIKWKYFPCYLLVLCEGNPPVTGGFPSQRSVTRSFDGFFDVHLLNKRLSKQSRYWLFETPYRSLLRHCNGCSPGQDFEVDLPVLSDGMSLV